MAVMRALLGSLAFLLVLFQYVTLAKLHRMAASVSYLSFSRFFSMLADTVPFDAVDGILAALVLAVCLAVVALEVRGRRLTLCLRQIFTSERQTVGLLLACAAVFVRFYLAPGEFNWAADSPQHIAYTDITARALAHAELPIWTYSLGTGSPYLQFYGFLFFWVAGAVGAVVGDTYLALKLTLFATHVASALGAYAVARAGGCRRGAAFVAGLAYVLCFWHTQQILIMGRLQVSIVYALLPWPFWGLERALGRAERALPHALAGGAALGLLILAHPGYGYWSCAFVALYGLARALTVGDRTGWTRDAIHVVSLLGVGLAVGAALVVPMWLDRGHTGLAPGYSLFGIPDPRWWHVLVWSNFRFWLLPPAVSEYHWYGGYLGLSLVLAAAAAAAGAWRLSAPRYRAPALAALAALAGGLFMVFGYRTWLVRALPNSDVLSSGRYLLFVAFFLSLAAGHGARALQLWGRRRRGTAATLTVLLLVIVADLGPTTFQHTYRGPREEDTAGIPLKFYDALRRSAEPYMDQGQLPDYRIVWSRGPLHRFMSTGLIYFYAQTPTPDGPHPGEIRAVFDFVRPFERLMGASMPPVGEGEVSQVQVDYPVYAGLCLLNVRYLLVHRADRSSFWLEQEHTSPIVVAPSLSPPLAGGVSPDVVSPAVLERLVQGSDPREVVHVTRLLAELRGMEVDPRQRTCRTFYIRGMETAVDLGTQPRVAVVEHTVRNQRVDLRVEVSERCFARLAYGYYPHVDVVVDGESAEPRVTTGGFVVLELDPGTHTITLEPRLSALRTVLMLTSLTVLVGVAVIFHRSRDS